MAQFRPAGLSDDDSDSDDFGFFDKPIRAPYFLEEQTHKKKTESKLQNAIINGNMQEVEAIIINDLNNNINYKLDSGWTSLIYACFHAQDNIVKMLLEKGADPNLHSDSVTPLMAVCMNSTANERTILNIVLNLMENLCLINIGDKHGETPLMKAICNGRVTVVQRFLEKNVNIEMRNSDGWTAVFWAVYYNQPEILEILIKYGARLNEVDKFNRSLLDIANLQDFQNIIEIISKYIKKDDNTDGIDKLKYIENQISSWHDFYPGIHKGERPNYISEIPHLLYGMNCERLTPLFMKSKMDLRTFLLLEEKDMIKLGIDMPYERQRLKLGLRNFHIRGWKLNAVAGLYARKNENYSVVDCLTTLGTHLQQLYILEATLQYTLREYNRIQNQIKYEPPDSPLLAKLKAAAKKLQININNIRKENKNMKALLSKISKTNLQPADLIREKTVQEIALSYVTEVIMICSLGYLVYHAKSFVMNLLRK